MRATAHVATLGAAVRTMQFSRLGRPEAIFRPFFVAAAAQATRPETIRITAKTQSRRPQRKYNKIPSTNASGKCVFFLVSYQKFLISDRYIFSSIPALIFPRSIKGANAGSSTPQNENMLRTKNLAWWVATWTYRREGHAPTQPKLGVPYHIHK